ncbi:hypothetical protein [Frondihabitans sp. PAMC 28766]|uniref:hypothetical protein n=1 Tax=Frondihabitans sp. PAMC 28766 TaxID=1795630 RepID=UPI0012FF5F63|nr:hypothetical protein [Frondihabitans sp. PAMC 28766]
MTDPLEILHPIRRTPDEVIGEELHFAPSRQPIDYRARRRSSNFCNQFRSPFWRVMPM